MFGDAVYDRAVREKRPIEAPELRPVQAPPIDRDASAIGLRLAIGREGLGIELARPAPLACADVIELVVRLPHVRFPFDVTGGVAKFRHRRGELERLAIEIDARRAARWAEPKVRGVIAAGPCSVTIAPRSAGATITILAREADELRVLVFDVELVPSQADVVLVVHASRGIALAAPASLLALRAASALLGGATREGSRFVVARAAERIARTLLPEAGMRAPEGDDVVVNASGESDGTIFIAFRSGVSAASPIAEAARANEAALLAREADDACFSGALERARQLDLALLERAPRHPEIARRIAEIDAHVGGRADAAAATLRDAEGDMRLGSLLGDLLDTAGDRRSAIATLLREAEREPAPLLAGLLFARAARLAENTADALAWLDLAIARAPRLAELRWDRAQRRLAAGRLSDARADFQELEALASGPRERHEVLKRAGDIHRAAGLGKEAAILYERALLYRPDDPAAIAGLGAAIAAEGRAPRGAALLAHAIGLSTAAHAPSSWMVLELARVLGDRLNDRPAAIARLRDVPDEAPEAIAARGLEGQYRADLGDAAGAALAYARLRARAGREASALPWLAQAATFEEGRGDLAAAQQHLAVAIAIAPNDTTLGERYRAVSERLAPPIAPPMAEPAAPAPPPVVEELDEAETEARVEALTRALQADPTNDAVTDELVVHLTRLGRSMDLLALLSARLEDAPPERRASLLPKHREVLARLEEEARAAGRDGEADLFKMAREAATD